MGRSWQFLAVVALIIGIGATLYYTSDFYAERVAGGPSATTTIAEPAPPDTPPESAREQAGDAGFTPPNE